jgi:hypothetical protein
VLADTLGNSYIVKERYKRYRAKTLCATSFKKSTKQYYQSRFLGILSMGLFCPFSSGSSGLRTALQLLRYRRYRALVPPGFSGEVAVVVVPQGSRNEREFFVYPAHCAGIGVWREQRRLVG